MPSDTYLLGRLLTLTGGFLYVGNDSLGGAVGLFLLAVGFLAGLAALVSPDS